jgi:hypothetical protein
LVPDDVAGQRLQPAQLDAVQPAHDEPTPAASPPLPEARRPKKPDMMRCVCLLPQLWHGGFRFAFARLTIRSKTPPQEPHSYS